MYEALVNGWRAPLCMLVKNSTISYLSKKISYLKMPLRVANPLFSLDSFEGPLDLLVHLVEKKELDVYEVVIHEVMHQYQSYLKTLMDYDLDLSAEFLSIVSSLMLLKSRTLLPKHEEKEVFDESALRVEILDKLIHYYRFKDLAEKLKDQEVSQSKRFFRGFALQEPFESKELKKPAHDQILVELFTEVMEKKRRRQTGLIEEEEYRVSDMIRFWKKTLKENNELLFFDVFNASEPKLKLITLFLALLELLKHGFAQIMGEQNETKIQIKEEEI